MKRPESMHCPDKDDEANKDRNRSSSAYWLFRSFFFLYEHCAFEMIIALIHAPHLNANT